MCMHIVVTAASLTDVQELILVPLHTPPTDAVTEIDALYDVYLDVKKTWGTEVSTPQRPFACQQNEHQLTEEH